MYTQALNKATPATPLEIKRSILSNRSQSYLQLGDIHNALRDTNQALSDKFTKPSSPEWITMKLHYRRAKIYWHMARYPEAQIEFDKFENSKSGSLTLEEAKFKNDIKASISSSTDRQKQALIRAVDVRCHDVSAQTFC
jgi:hypothetical protein